MIIIKEFLTNNFHFNILLLLGLALFGGTLGGRLFQKLKIPQVVGYIFIGLILGDTFTGFISADTVNSFQPLSYFALGLIGFMIGGELKKSVFLKHGKQFLIILFSEGLTAFLLVAIITSIVSYFVFRSFNTSIALGLLLGAIASATAPAATTDVLREYRTKGPLTKTILGIVAMDDGLALILFAIASAIAGIIMGTSHSSVFMLIGKTLYEIVGSLVLGGSLGLILSKTLKLQRDEDKMLMFSLGFVLLSIGISIALKMDMLITTMTLGAITVNTAPRRSRDVFSLTEKFTPPIYVLFFVLVGAKLNLSNISVPIILLASAYLFGRTSGKIFGAYFGAKIAKAPEGVRKFLPLCLFSQAGVAIGLSILASHRFSSEISNIIVVVITLTTFIVQIIGPYFVKLAVSKAGETGLNITEEDMLKSTIVSDLINEDIPVINENANLNFVLEKFAKTDNIFFPVIDNDNTLKGIISIDKIKQTFMESDLASILLAHDIMEIPTIHASMDEAIIDVQNTMNSDLLEYIPILDNNNRLVGFLERRQIQKLLSLRIAQLNQKAEQLG